MTVCPTCEGNREVYRCPQPGSCSHEADTWHRCPTCAGTGEAPDTEYGVRWPDGDVEPTSDLVRARAIAELHRTPVLVARKVTRSPWASLPAPLQPPSRRRATPDPAPPHTGPDAPYPPSGAR